MTNAELMKFLQTYPDDMEIKIYSDGKKLRSLTDDDIDDFAADDKVDEEAGFKIAGNGERFLIINSPVN